MKTRMNHQSSMSTESTLSREASRIPESPKMNPNHLSTILRQDNYRGHLVTKLLFCPSAANTTPCTTTSTPLAEIKTERLANSDNPPTHLPQPTIESSPPRIFHAHKREPRLLSYEVKAERPTFTVTTPKAIECLPSSIDRSPRKRSLFAPSPPEHPSVGHVHDRETDDSTPLVDIDSDAAPRTMPVRQFDILKEAPCPSSKTRNRKRSRLTLIMKPAPAQRIKNNPVRRVLLPLWRVGLMRFNLFGNVST